MTDFEKYHVALKMYVVPMKEVSPTEVIDFLQKISSTGSASLEIWNDEYRIFL